MKKLIVLAALLALASPVFAQTSPDVVRVPLAIAWDMDGEAADADQIVAGPDALADSTTYTLDAQPDTCRLVDITVADGDSSISAGVLTVTGTDCFGDALVCTFTFASGGTGVKSLTKSSGSATTCSFATVGSVVTGALTGEGGGDTLIVGYTSNSAYTYPIYGVRKVANGVRFVDPFATSIPQDTITINGTALASYHTETGGAFGGLAVGDLIYITTHGQTFERRLTAVASDDAATMDAALPTSEAPSTTAETAFRYKKFFKLVEPQDAWVPLAVNQAAFYVFDVDANANTGGVTSSIECAVFGAFSHDDFDPNVQVDTDNIASASTGQATTSIDVRLAPYTHCRAGLKFGTGDDADAANEDLNLYLMLRRN